MIGEVPDLWDFAPGTWEDDSVTSRFGEEGSQESLIRGLKALTSKPVVGVGRFTSPDLMARMVREGVLDFIGSARPSIADPFLPKKIDEGRIEEIRECIGCNVCDSRMGLPARIICTQNPTAGEEYRRAWNPEQFSSSSTAEQSVLVVGAGPAGLECAITMARQGVEAIHLVEAEREVGGHFRWVPRLPGLAEWSRVIDYRRTMCEKLRNLAVVTNKRLSLDEILDYGADRVVFATGSHWAADGLNGFSQGPIAGADASLDYVFTPEQIMGDGAEVPGERILVYDCEGYFTGMSISERLALEGKEVVYVTPLESPAPYLRLTGEQEVMTARLRKLGAGIFPDAVVEAMERGRARGILRSDPTQSLRWDVDAFVLVTQRVPDGKLYHALSGDHDRLRTFGIRSVARVGDCLAPRPQVADAIFDAHRLARNVDQSEAQLWMKV
jgi:dimethylamine/trimethylamine dehydrogenase